MINFWLAIFFFCQCPFVQFLVLEDSDYFEHDFGIIRRFVQVFRAEPIGFEFMFAAITSNNAETQLISQRLERLTTGNAGD